ncbi:MAG: hypothetical protein IPK42_11215 [Betaproteobacteria bacterium]|nr:hypothetical protein [Betaproteobacteria bacterium]
MSNLPWPIKPYPKNPPPPLARAFDWDDAPEDKYEPEPELDDDYEVGICPAAGSGMFGMTRCATAAGWVNRCAETCAESESESPRRR